MVVFEPAKALILRLLRPAQVLAAVPGAAETTVGGHPVVAVRHTVEAVRILRAMGLYAPSPILHYYDWPGVFPPFDHQRSTAAFLTLRSRCLVLNSIGTGKTAAALWAADYLMRVGSIKRVLIVSPLSTLERVWGDAIFTGLPNRKFTVLHGAAARRKALAKKDVDFYIVNHDGFRIVADQMAEKVDLVIVDEAAVYRNPRTQRFKQFFRWTEDHPNIMLWLMTGTPTPDSPVNAWALGRLVRSPEVTASFGAFRDRVMYRASQWRWVPRPGAEDVVRSVLQPAVRYTREECLDLPATIFQSRHVPLTKEQETHYKQMLKHLVVELQDTTISAANEAVKVQKLVQIACGVAYDDEGANVTLDCAPRLAQLEELIEEAGEKVIVFAPLTGVLERITTHLGKRWSTAMVNGSVSATARNEIFRNFQQGNDPHILVAHPQTMAHGLTLTAATTIIWYGPTSSNDVYEQANGRIERTGKNKTCNVIHIESTYVERQAYERVKNKQSFQGLLLDAIQQERI